MLCSHKIDEPGSAYKYCKMPLLLYPYFVKKIAKYKQIYNTLTCATKSGITNILKIRYVKKSITLSLQINVAITVTTLCYVCNQ